ncbi:long-chain-fatty-acid--CoA ligase [Bacillus sp. FJAT-47783]|uniref:long-chain-fatty-acid--CoA ligase n=1 Tax=Bacillus sp. FJAT-47783 TaxID=2922712 RepID=UPI001FADC8E8|nr:long-chain-fatty-acid--CoA ligase [Bacillus sp. FJAT-47783]
MIMTKGLLYAARTYPEKIAIIDGDETYTYKEFMIRTAKLKAALHKLQVKKGDRVGILLLNNYRYLEIMYAATSFGAIVVPMNVRLNANEVAFILKDAEVKTLFIHKEFLPMVNELKEKVPSLQHIILAENSLDEEELNNHSVLLYESVINNEKEETLTIEQVEEEDIAGLFYTGGTTGRSKGVMLTHKNVVNNAYHAALNLKYDEKEIYLHAAPMFHLADQASTLAITLVGGTHAHVRSFTPVRVLEAIQKNNITAVLLVPTMINMFINAPQFDQYDVNSLRKILYGASPMSVELLKKAMKCIPNATFMQAYGMTEAAPILTVLRGEDHVVEGSDQQLKRLMSCGQPVQGVEMKVVDPNGEEAPNGQVGEIVAKAPNIMKGYWNLKEETAHALRNGWYYTGDLGYKDDDDYYYIVDRAKDMIITGGENVYSTEVENVLYEHPSILECAVIGTPNEKWGEVVTAVIVLKEGMTLSEQELKAFTKEKLADFKVPKIIEFTNELPKSGAGKILKRHLRDQHWHNQTKKVH